MTNTQFLNELLNITETQKDGFKVLDIIKYNNLIDKIKLEIAAEENKTLTSKQRINFVNTFLKGRIFEKKPIFKCFDDTQIKDKAIFTDSYFLVALSKNDLAGLPLINFKDFKKDNPHITEYPKIDKIIINDFEKLPYNITLKVNDILNDIKAAGKPKSNIYDTSIIYTYDNDKKIGFESNEMKAFLNFMNFKPNDTITLYFKNNYSPAHTQNNNNSYGLILPIRLD